MYLFCSGVAWWAWMVLYCEMHIWGVYSSGRAVSHTRTNAPVIRHMPAGNLLLSAGILPSGSTFAKTEKFATIMHMPIPSKSRVLQNSESLLNDYWTIHQTAILSVLSSCELLHICGDGRSDSPGFSDKYTSYTILDTKTQSRPWARVRGECGAQRLGAAVWHGGFFSSSFHVLYWIVLSTLVTLSKCNLQINMFLRETAFPLEFTNILWISWLWMKAQVNHF